MKNKILTILILFFLLVSANFLIPQERDYYPIPMNIDVGNLSMSMNKLMGDGGLQSQFSWNLTGNESYKTEIFYWPADRWQSNILYQIFNPLSLDDNGILKEDSVRASMYSRGAALTNYGATDWAFEVRKFRPPTIIVDGLQQNQFYRWYVDRNLKSDLKIEFEDVLPQFGIRSHIEIYAFSNQDHGDYFIWKATHKFTGEVKLPRNAKTFKDTLPDQTIKFSWPISFSFGPSKAGEKSVLGTFGYEGEDDLDSWFKKASKYPDVSRDSLYVAYYWDTDNPTAQSYSNGSSDDTGDPDKITGFLHSTQIPGFTLLYADKSTAEKTDDLTQPYAMPHASIVADLWGRRDVGLKKTYRGDDQRGRFPLDAITAGLATSPQKGPMRFITVGPYELTKNLQQGRIDSLTFVYAIGVGGVDYETADSLGKAWMNKSISDSAKNKFIELGKDRLWQSLDNANWAWDKLSRGLSIPAAPPSPDLEVKSGPNNISVNWSYPDPSYYNDAVTGVDDWYLWRVYKKQGAAYVNDPLDQGSGSRWQFIFETTDRNRTSFIDTNVVRGLDYYYAVTAVDDGTQNNGINPGQKLESSRYVSRSKLPAVPYKPGLNTLTENQVRVVPNPATVAQGSALSYGHGDKISFFNLPYKCTLNIFTETGDIVKRIEHEGTADDGWDQKTDGNQYVSSGIYVLAVTDAKALDGTALESQFIRFVLIR